MTVERLTVVVALVAAVVAAAVVVAVWRREVRRAHRSRLRHPTAPAPVHLELDTTHGLPRWRVSVRPAAPTTAVDIVTYRPSGTDRPWVSEPIVDPIVLEPGQSALLSNEVIAPAARYDVVVAWTIRHTAGDVQGSRTLTVSTAPAAVSPMHVADAGRPAILRTAWVPVAAAVSLVLLAAVAAVGAWQLTGNDADDAALASTSTPPTPASSVPPTTGPTSVPADATTTAPSAGPVTSPPSTDTATSTNATTTTTTAATTTTSTTTTSTTTTTTASTSTTTTTTTTERPATTTTSTAAVATATTAAGAPRVVISGRVEDCRFGAACLIASFFLDGFTGSGEYVCEFEDGSRFEFRYVGDRADDACVASGADPSITIEVDGVRSATITRDDPNGP